MSRRKFIRRCINLIYRIAAASEPNCQIEQSSLRHIYPDTNYDVVITLETLPKMERLVGIMQEALTRRSIGGTIRGFLNPHGEWEMHVWPYPEGNLEIHLDTRRG